MDTTKKTTPAKAEVVNDKAIIAQENTLVKSDADIDGFIAKRQEFITKVNAICVEGKDYHVIQGKKSLAKGGAEKIASIFGWVARFDKDDAVSQAFADVKGLISFVCNLQKGDICVGQGRGASTLSKNGGDPNKTIKMAQKSAYIDAVIRSSGLSDFYTQDLEDMPQDQISKPQYTNDGNIVEKPSNKKPTEKQVKLIKDLCKQKNIGQAEILELAKGKTPSELIDLLFKHPTNPTPEKVIDATTRELSPEDKAMVEDIPF